MQGLQDWVSKEFENLAQVINDYDHNLYLEMVPVAEHHTLTDATKVFRIVDDRTKSIVLYASAVDNPTQILTRLWSMDNGKHDVLLEMDAQNAAIEALKNQREIEAREAIKDFVQFVGKNTKSRWVHEGRVRNEHFQDLGPKRVVIDK